MNRLEKHNMPMETYIQEIGAIPPNREKNQAKAKQKYKKQFK